MIFVYIAMGAVLNVLDDSPRSLVVPGTAPGPPGITGGPTARSDRSCGRPGLPSSSPPEQLTGYRKSSKKFKSDLMDLVYYYGYSTDSLKYTP